MYSKPDLVKDNYIRITYYDTDRTTRLASLSVEKCEQYIATGEAYAVRSKNGAIRRLHRLPRERVYSSAGDAIRAMNSASSRTVERVRFEDGTMASPRGTLQHKPQQYKATPLPVTEV